MLSNFKSQIKGKYETYRQRKEKRREEKGREKRSKEEEEAER